MAMDIESLGGGAATGFVAAILSLLGVTGRLNKLEKEKADKVLVEELRKTVENNRLVSEGLLRGSVEDVRRMIEANKEDTVNMVGRIEKDIAYIRERIDNISDKIWGAK
jgi:hypothetical protein